MQSERIMSLLAPDDLEYLRSEDLPGGRYRSMLDDMANGARQFAANFHDDPALLSDWGHKYFCPLDGGRLLWNPDNSRKHVCVVCGAEYSGAPYDQVWVTFYRNEAFQAVRKAAALYAVRGGREWIDLIEKILGFYADAYARFEPHSKEHIAAGSFYGTLGAGKIMPQGLNEAIIVVRSIQALELAADGLDPGFLVGIREKFLLPARDFLLPQADRIHNIPCWIDAALGCIGLYTGDAPLVHAALNARKFGLGAQLSQGVTKDGFWFEGSLHYHFFLLEGVLSFLVLAARKGIRRPTIERAIARMVAKPFEVAFGSGRLPNPNDGWPDIGLKTYSYAYDLGAALLGECSQAAELAERIEEDSAPRSDVPLSRPYYFEGKTSLERLLFNPRQGAKPRPAGPAAPERRSMVYRASCFAMLRQERLNVFLKYGHNGPSHAHPDKMTLEVVAGGAYLSRDLSNAGYGARLCDEWHRTTAGHNTVVVDRKDQVSMERGRLLWFRDREVATRAKEVYPGVDFERIVSITPTGFHDSFVAISAETHDYDWFFHVDGTAIGVGKPGRATVKDFSVFSVAPSGYLHVKDMRCLGEASDLEVTWRFAGGLARCLLFCPGAEAFIATTPDNPVDKSRSTLLIRQRATRAEFKVSWTIEEECK